MVLNWTIAFLGLAYFFFDRLDKKQIREDFKFKIWILDNAKDLIKGFLAVTILMIVFVNSEVISYIQPKLEEVGVVFKYFPYAKIVSLVIGLLNYWLMSFIRSRAKKKMGKIK